MCQYQFIHVYIWIGIVTMGPHVSIKFSVDFVFNVCFVICHRCIFFYTALNELNKY